MLNIMRWKRSVDERLERLETRMNEIETAVAEIESDDAVVIAAFKDFKDVITGLKAGTPDDKALAARLVKVHNDLAAALAPATTGTPTVTPTTGTPGTTYPNAPGF